MTDCSYWDDWNSPEDSIYDLPPVNEYGYCTECKYKRGVGCKCGLTFAEKVKTVGIDEEALRIFNMGGKGRKKDMY